MVGFVFIINIVIIAHDIDKTKTKLLKKGGITCIKKPIQGYNLSKLLRRVKETEFEMHYQLSLRN